MDEINQEALRTRYHNAIDQFVDKLKVDINVIAAIVHGSVAYDVIWEKSDVDMTVVIRDQHLKNTSLSIIEDGIIFNLQLITRTIFKRELDRAIGGSFTQAFFSNGKIVYSTEESFYEYFEDIRIIGDADIAITALHLGNELVSYMDKVEKWLKARKDTYYAQYFLLKAAEPLANMELNLRGIPTSRSAIQKALELNPKMMKVFYEEPMSHAFTEKEILEAIELLDHYLEEKMDIFKKPVIEYLSDGQIKTTAMIASWLHIESHFIVDALIYLADKGVIDKVPQQIKLTPKSRYSAEEIGFIYIV